MGILKNTKKIFNRYQNKNLTLEKRFYTPEVKNKKFLEKVKKNFDRSFFEALLHPFETIEVGLAHYDQLTNYIYSFINQFTNHSEYTDEDMSNFKDYLIKRFKEIESIEYKGRDSCTINLKNGKDFYFQTLTSSFDGILDVCPDLLTSKREGKCHKRSIVLTHVINNDCECVTGTVYPFTTGAKYLHSWVELKDGNGAIYCLDNNLNAVMLKDDYYKLMHAKPFERISQENIVQDANIINYFNEKTCSETPYLKLYCSSREEALEKYRELMDKENQLI